MADHPTQQVRTHRPLFLDQQQSFQELMAEQLRHAPWLMLSIALHALLFLVLYFMPTAPEKTDEQPITLNPPEEVPEIAELEDPEVEAEPEETEEEPVLQDTEITEITEQTTETFEDVSDRKQAAFDGIDWNAAIGLGAGAGPRYGRRASGRQRMARGGNAVAPTIGAALEWLARHQDDDGKWDADDFSKHDTEGEPCDGPGLPVHDVGVTGLALLALLGDGSTMREGPYKREVKKAVRWLRQQQDLSSKGKGLFGTPSSNEFIYDHTIAALAMIEAYGLSDYRVLRDNAQGGINYLEYHRNPYNVWRYQPRDGDNDTSVTGWVVMAYKSAKDFDLEVNDQALELAETWLDSVTDPTTGRTGYTERGGWSSRRQGDHAAMFPRDKGECMTAVSLLIRFFLGHNPEEDKLMPQQADLILEKPPVWNPDDGSIDHYYWYYATYALYQMGGRPWKEWERALTDAVVDTQRTEGNYEGSWDPIGVWGEDGGRVYSTALLCLTLEAYYRYTRVFLR